MLYINKCSYNLPKICNFKMYIARVRERYQGRWICGLCTKVVKDELFLGQRGSSTLKSSESTHDLLYIFWKEWENDKAILYRLLCTHRQNNQPPAKPSQVFLHGNEKLTLPQLFKSMSRMRIWRYFFLWSRFAMGLKVSNGLLRPNLLMNRLGS